MAEWWVANCASSDQHKMNLSAVSSLEAQLKQFALRYIYLTFSPDLKLVIYVQCY